MTINEKYKITTINEKYKTMMVTIKSKDGYKVDVTRLYIQALSKEITPKKYKKELEYITSHNKPYLKV